VSEPLLVRGGRVVDPAAGRDGAFDLLLRGGVVVAVGSRLSADGARFSTRRVSSFSGIHRPARPPARAGTRTGGDGRAGLRAAAAGDYRRVRDAQPIRSTTAAPSRSTSCRRRAARPVPGCTRSGR
jgi:dihydroorotase